MDDKWEAFKDRFTRLVAGALAEHLGPKKTAELARAIDGGKGDAFTAALAGAGRGAVVMGAWE